ncbi:MAG: putative Ig domain-containing protein, partial [Candidatus Latescibacterota bacterium]
SATDDDGDGLTYSASSLPSGAGFNSSTRTFSWTPSYSQSGTYSNVHFEVSDGHGGSDSENITITVNDVDTTPPTVSIYWPPSDNGPANVTFQWSGSDNITPVSELTYSYNLDGGSWSGWTSSKSKSYTGLSYHWHTFEVRVKDHAGNIGSDSEQYHANIPAPVLLSASPGYYNVSLSWSSSPDATGYKVKYWRYNPYSTVTVDVGNTTSTTIGLVAGIAHYFNVRAYCAHGKTSDCSNTMSAVPQGGGGW